MSSKVILIETENKKPIELQEQINKEIETAKEEDYFLVTISNIQNIVYLHFNKLPNFKGL